ncbi:hypothetical protein HYS95_03835 [Candidatus Daviesbacteria bacterium]|nr:hypothetical protein [Candidatus Daviesbacteria bacterium]
MDTAAISQFRESVYQNLLDLITDTGIRASGKDEIYGCIFGRDSALTILKILKVYKKSPSLELLQICRKALLTLCALQGKETNIESGEQPGKFIHEYRTEKHEHLTGLSRKPWYIYPDGIMRNYDSLDSTPLALMAIYKYWEVTQDREFLILALPNVEQGLNWIMTYGDANKDSLVDYQLHADRKHGGLAVQSWTDSHESLKGVNGLFPKYPIAPVEVQGKAWLALKLWSKFYADRSPQFAKKLSDQANRMKYVFNKLFIFKEDSLYEDGDYYFGGQAIDGEGRLIKTITANPLICLWAAEKSKDQTECIIKEEFLEGLVARAFKPDLFDEGAGIRTMSALSPTFNPNKDSYHNGSFWPMLNGLITEGLENFGFLHEAERLKQASLKPLFHFKTPVELYIKDHTGNFTEYLSATGQTGCRVQAWSAASVLDWLT